VGETDFFFVLVGDADGTRLGSFVGSSVGKNVGSMVGV